PASWEPDAHEPAGPDAITPDPAATDPSFPHPSAPHPSASHPAYPPAPHPYPAPALPADIATWLDDQARDAVHPHTVENMVRRSGWHPAQIAMASAQYRERFNEHTLGYSALLVATGVGALAAGTAGHILAGGLDHSVNRNQLAIWLTALAVSLPFAIWAHLWAAKVDRDDPVAVWSRPRRTLANVLVWACGIVGVYRLLRYAAQLIGTLLHATWAAGDSAAAGAINVAITVGIALPLGLWAFSFLHRFDDEDPTQPSQPTRSSRSAARSPRRHRR
ncbi:MAG: hypothetical protein QOK39_2530, partial [Acidimicrobiaceae bacterium]|nr:hypothetical protein [Acidimicrobiaceae bacterium]